MERITPGQRPYLFLNMMIRIQMMMQATPMLTPRMIPSFWSSWELGLGCGSTTDSFYIIQEAQL